MEPADPDAAGELLVVFYICTLVQEAFFDLRSILYNAAELVGILYKYDRGKERPCLPFGPQRPVLPKSSFTRTVPLKKKEVQGAFAGDPRKKTTAAVGVVIVPEPMPVLVTLNVDVNDHTTSRGRSLQEIIKKVL